MSIPQGVVIVGAGIGGLVLGRALARGGREFEIFDRAPELAAVGAGILLQPNAVAALRHLGLDEEVIRAGRVLRRGRGETVEGTVLHATNLEGFGAPTVAIHRARLQSILVRALGGSSVRTAKALQRFEQDGTSVSAFFNDGTSVRSDLLVGADGVHSAVRAQLIGSTPLRYAGYTCWRGVGTVAAPEDELFELWGRGLRFGIVPIAADQAYWFAVANAPEGTAGSSDHAALVARFKHFGPRVQTLIEATPLEQITNTDIYDRAPISSWSEGRVVLLGDAAHPTTPNLGQGGCMAIEDAAVLGHQLLKWSDRVRAIHEYEARRVARTAAIVKESRQFGRIAQLEGRLSTWLRNGALRATPQRVIHKRLREAAEFSLD